MSGVVDGIRVVELASWGFVPLAGATLGDWGADVVKIEHPDRPEPLRALVPNNMARVDIKPRFPGADTDPARIFMEQANRSKRSIGLNVSTPGGYEIFTELIKGADVFLTNLLPSKRARLKVTPEDVWAINPGVVYVRGSGFGVHGDEADKPGFDGTAFLSRGSWAHQVTPAGSEWPVLSTGVAGIGDLPGSMMIVAGILGGLVKRERTGQAPVVDVSLLATAMWQMAPAILTTALYDMDDLPRMEREKSSNPLSIFYRIRGDRFIKFSMQQSQPFYADLCQRLDKPEWIDDPRFATQALRKDNSAEFIAALDEVMGQLDLAELTKRLDGFQGPWALVQTAREIQDDPQVIANGYIRPVHSATKPDTLVVGPPVQFDEQPAPPSTAAPEHGEHTDEILLELGMDMDTILAHKVAGDIL